MMPKSVSFRPFTEEHYIRFVKWGYDPTGSCIENRPKYVTQVKGLVQPSPYTKDSFIKRVSEWFKSNETPLTFSLSGGLDSSFIFSIFLKSGSNVPYEIISYENEEDLSYVYLLLKALDVRVGPRILPKPTSVGDDELIEMMKAQKSPMDLGSMQGNYFLISNAQNPIIVTGDGSDEIFGGYFRHRYYNTSPLDVEEELFYYHIPRVLNYCNHFGKESFSPYLWLIDTPDLFKPGKLVLKEWARDYLPSEIINREKRALKSDDAKQGLEYRAKLVDLWKRNV